MASSKIEEDIRTLLAAFRGLAGGRYACLLEPDGILFEDPEPEEAALKTLHTFLHAYRKQVFAIPEGLAAEGPAEDIFEGWQEDDFFLAFINRRVVLVVVCPDGEALREQAERPLQALADRLLRFKDTYRMDAKGRGYFFGRARLDIVVAGRAR